VAEAVAMSVDGVYSMRGDGRRGARPRALCGSRATTPAPLIAPPPTRQGEAPAQRASLA
jgi:hypothetical protein